MQSDDNVQEIDPDKTLVLTSVNFNVLGNYISGCVFQDLFKH